MKMKEMRKKPMNDEELFTTICRLLKQKNQLPDILDYYCPNEWCTDGNYLVDTEDVSLTSRLDYGCEGIYLDLYLELHQEKRSFGTFKTLETNRDAMAQMGMLLGNFVAEFLDYIRENSDDFTWSGYGIRILDPNKTRGLAGYYCQDLNQALLKKDMLLLTYRGVTVIDYAKHEQTVYTECSLPVMTDDEQMLLSVKENEYTFAEIRPYYPDDETSSLGWIAVFSGTVNLNHYPDMERDAMVRPYYAEGLSQVKKEYGELSSQIVAECIFEQMSDLMVKRVSDPVTDRKEARRFLSDFARSFAKGKGGAA